MINYSMEGRTYRYFNGRPLFPFGYGLSYSTFSYSKLAVPNTVKAGDNITVRVTVTNNGPFDADEVRTTICCIPKQKVKYSVLISHTHNFM